MKDLLKFTVDYLITHCAYSEILVQENLIHNLFEYVMKFFMNNKFNNKVDIMLHFVDS